MSQAGALPLAQLEREAQLRDFRGRQALLGRLREGDGGFTLILGGPGTGKSALMAALSRALGAPYHFVRCHRDPRRFVPALFAQGVALLPDSGARSLDQRGQESWSSDDWRNALVSALAEVVAHRGHAALVLDGVDELERPHELGAYLPTRLPPGARVFLSARPSLELVSSVRAQLTPLELYAIPPLASSDLTPSALPRQALDSLVERTRGLPLLLFPALRRAEARGTLDPTDAASSAHALFEALLSRLRAQIGSAATPLLSVLWAAGEPLAPREVQASLWHFMGESAPDLPHVREQLDAASELLRVDEVGRVAFWHASFTDYVGEELLGAGGRRRAHAALAAFAETTPDSEYAASHHVAHLVGSDQFERARQLAEDPARMARMLARGRLPELLTELARAQSELLHLVRRHAALLARQPAALPGVFSFEGRELPGAVGPWLRTLSRPAAATERPSRVVFEGAAEISDLALSPRSGRLATASHDGFVRVFERASGAMVSARRVSAKRALSLAFGRDERVVCGTDEGVVVIRVDDVATESRALCSAPQWGVALAESGALATAGRDGTLTLWSESLEPLWRASVPFAVTSLAFSGDESALVATGARGGIAVVDLLREPARIVRVDEDYAETTWGAAAHGSLVAVARHDGWLRVLRREGSSLRLEHPLHFADEHLFAVTFCQTTGELFCAGSSGRIHKVVVRRDGLALVGSLRAHDGWINGLRAERGRVFSVGTDGTLRAHDLADWTGTAAHDAEAPAATALALGGAEGDVVLGFDDGTIRCSEGEGSPSRAVLRVADTAVSALAASQRLVLVGARDGTLRLLRQLADERTRKPRWKRLAALAGHQAEVTACVFLKGSHQGLVASAGRDHAVKLWSVLGARLLAAIELPASVLELDATPTELVARCRDGAVYRLRVPSLALVEDQTEPEADARVLHSGATATGRALGLRPDECAVFDGRGARLATAPIGFFRAVKAARAERHEWLALGTDGLFRLALVEPS